MNEKLKVFLNAKVREYNQPSFISLDPVSVPHRFAKKHDIEIAGFFAAVFAWGNRNTAVRKTNELLNLMDNSPHAFCLNWNNKKQKHLSLFKHRTFNDIDLHYFMDFLIFHYTTHSSLEQAFLPGGKFTSIEASLNYFHHYFFSLPHAPQRTKKHITAPFKNSTCKRLNMFLRWMVRKDDKGVDFGIWKKIKASELICPLDVHVARVSRKLELIKRTQTDWQTALELTENLKNFDKADPVKYDFALFSLGIHEKF